MLDRAPGEIDGRFRGGDPSAPPVDTDMILKALKRDQDKMLNPQTTPFTSANNAYDSLLPYHVFLSPTYDDLIHQSVQRKSKVSISPKTFGALAVLLLSKDDSKEEMGVMEERLRVEEERYCLNKTIHYRKTKVREIEERYLDGGVWGLEKPEKRGGMNN